MWTCPKCKREFQKNNQSHSCVVYPLERHFEGKEFARELFDFYIAKIQKEVGPIKIESLPCCIHLVSSYTFGAVWAMKDKIRIDFRVDKKLTPEELKKLPKMYSELQMSPNRYLYHFDIVDSKQISSELLDLIRDSYKLNK